MLPGISRLAADHILERFENFRSMVPWFDRQSVNSALCSQRFASARSALVNIRRKALLSSVGFRKRMTSRLLRGSSCDSCKLRFDRPL